MSSSQHAADASPIDGRGLIRVVGAREHNLKNISLDIPREAMTVITGLSGSGKSTLAFDTIYAEGQRRYVESLSAYARQFLEQLQKPDVDRIEGLSPTIAIDQRIATASPRSIVATTTEIYDYLRVLFARAGTPRCPTCDQVITRQSTSQMVDAVLGGPAGQRIMVLAPVVSAQRGAHKTLLEEMVKEGFIRARIDDDIVMIEDAPALSPNRKHNIDIVVDRLTIKDSIRQRLADSIETATTLSGGRVLVAAEVEAGKFVDAGFSAALACPVHANCRVEELSPRLFSFNSPHGACPSCNGLGNTLEFDPDLIVPDRDQSIVGGAVVAMKKLSRAGRPRKKKKAASASEMAANVEASAAGGSAASTSAAKPLDLIEAFCKPFDVLPDIPARNIPADKWRILMHGTSKADAERYGVTFPGVIAALHKRWQETESETIKQKLHGFQAEAPCPACHGARLRGEALWVRIGEHNIASILQMTIVEALAYFDDLTLEGEAAIIAKPLLREIRSRLKFMTDVGVEYLSLSRASATLSGGEAQRIRLATQIGSGLVGVCYVLDEPTVGLHPHDTRKLAKILRELARMGNTVIVVEHDEQIITGADHVIDVGPGAGERGGEIIAEGTLQDMLQADRSLTGKYLSGARQIELPAERRALDPRFSIQVFGAAAHNLRDIDVTLPLGGLVCVTGPSGSGKSTLVTQIIQRALRRHLSRGGPKPGPYRRITGLSHVDKIIEINQSPIGKTPRSNPATYVGVLDLIRQLYAKTREARIRGYGPPRFSFNIKGGRCEQCQGQGTKRIEMHFLPDVFVTCDACAGKRYNRETLEIRFRGKNMADVLDMRVEEALRFFDNFANVRQRLQALKDVGLGYMALGQASNTLSGGEAQRVKLAAELGKSAEGHTLYILDEPTTGLHFADVHTLLTALNRLAVRSHSVMVIEHNLDVVKMADWVIDLGPGGGEHGGRVVVAGTPEKVAACAESPTGRYLKERLAGGALHARAG